MVFQDVSFLLSRASFSSTFLKNCGRCESLGPPHVLKLWFGVSNNMFPVRHFCSSKPLFVTVKFNGDHKTTTKMR